MSNGLGAEVLFAITLQLSINEVIFESFTYDEKRVTSPGSNLPEPLSLQSVIESREATQKFIDLVINNSNPPVDDQESSLSSEVIETIDTTINWEFSIGDLTVESAYDVDLKEFEGEQSPFDISWNDFLAFVRSFDDFLNVVSNRG